MQKNDFFFYLQRDLFYSNRKKKLEKLSISLINSAAPYVTPICIPLHSYMYRQTLAHWGMSVTSCE